MSEPLPKHIVDQHIALRERASELMQTEILYAESPDETRVSLRTWFRLWRAKRLLSKALRLCPKSWETLWGLGKIEQRLQRDEAALDYFALAYQLRPEHVDVARESGIAALQAGRAESALELCLAAVNLDPENHGLIANLALAYILSGQDEAAHRCIQRSLALSPEDSISLYVQEVVQHVAAGKIPRPRSLRELG
ncbi:MAG: tetratricopeptide repeat protein [Planctomycetota bacterium]